MDLDGVLIDFGDTLAYINEEGYRRYEEALLSVIRKRGYQGCLNRLHSVFGDALGGSSRGELGSLQEFWQLFLENLGVSNVSAMAIRELEEVRSHHSPVMFKLYEGALQVLYILRKKYRLALVSNCAIGTSDVIKALGLTDFFEVIVLSYEVGVRKPGERIYLEALRGLKLEPQRCIFVADEISDLEGARALELKTMLVRQGVHTTHEAEDPHFKPDFQCCHIAEVTNFL